MRKTLRAFPALALSLALSLPAQAAASETITVSAAASLIDAFQAIAHEYEARRPGDTVHLNFAGSGTLLQQIDKGAPVDVFASADEHTMDQAETKGLVDTASRRVFARNHLVLVQSLGAATRITSLSALNDVAVRRIAVGNPLTVPAGRYAHLALEAAGLQAPVQDKIIPTSSVRQALDYVSRGEVDAAFVYQSDAAAMAHKVQVAMQVPLESSIDYTIAQVGKRRGGKQSAVTHDSKMAAQHSSAPTRIPHSAAEAFIELVLSPFGQEVLKQHGFLPALR